MYLADVGAPDQYWVPETEEVHRVLLEVCMPATDPTALAQAIIRCSRYGELTFDEPDPGFNSGRPPTPPNSYTFRLWVINLVTDDNWVSSKKWIEEVAAALWVRKCGQRSRTVRGRWVDPTIM